MFSYLKYAAARSLGCSSAQDNAFNVGESYLVKCQKQCAYSTIWGCPSDGGWITHDSVICRVSQMLKIQLGSPFTVIMSQGRNGYEACTLNGITSESYGTWDASYRISPGVGK